MHTYARAHTRIHVSTHAYIQTYNFTNILAYSQTDLQPDRHTARATAGQIPSPPPTLTHSLSLSQSQTQSEHCTKYTRSAWLHSLA